MSDERELVLDDFPVRWPVTTRWSDNDMFGHLNNAVYYELFDSAINGWLASRADVDGASTHTPGVVVESGCKFFAELAFPQPLVVGVRVAKLGNSSVTYQLGLFAQPTADGESPPAAAVGHWVHVYIDRDTRRPVPIPPQLRAVMQTAAG